MRSLPGITVDGTSIVTSDEILELKQVPRSLVVIGAGAVGIEFASIFARFGSQVTVIELLPRVLPLEDEEISAEAGKLLAKYMTIHTGRQDGGGAQDRARRGGGLPHRRRRGEDAHRRAAAGGGGPGAR